MYYMQLVFVHPNPWIQIWLIIFHEHSLQNLYGPNYFVYCTYVQSAVVVRLHGMPLYICLFMLLFLRGCFFIFISCIMCSSFHDQSASCLFVVQHTWLVDEEDSQAEKRVIYFLYSQMKKELQENLVYLELLCSKFLLVFYFNA